MPEHLDESDKCPGGGGILVVKTTNGSEKHFICSVLGFNPGPAHYQTEQDKSSSGARDILPWTGDIPGVHAGKQNM